MAQPIPGPDFQGSTITVLKQSETVTVSGATIQLYEPLENKSVPHEKWVIYAEPVFLIKRPDPSSTNEAGTSDGSYSYTLDALTTTDEIMTAAADKFSVKPKQVSMLSHAKVTFRIQGLKDVEITPLGQDAHLAPLNQVVKLFVTVPAAKNDAFLRTLQRGTLLITATWGVLVAATSVASVALTVSEIFKTKAYKNAKVNGANFVTAEQANDMYLEASRLSQLESVAGTGSTPAMMSEAKQLLEEVLKRDASLKVSTAEEAKALNEKMLEGLNIKPEDYQPITLLWDVAETIKTATSYTEANEKVRQFEENNDEKIKKIDEFGEKLSQAATTTSTGETSFFANGGGKWGPFKGKAGGSKKTSIGTTKSDFFATEKEFQDYLDRMTSERVLRSDQDVRTADNSNVVVVKKKGTEVVIESRGLDLVDGSSFLSHMNEFVQASAYKAHAPQMVSRETQAIVLPAEKWQQLHPEGKAKLDGLSAENEHLKKRLEEYEGRLGQVKAGVDRLETSLSRLDPAVQDYAKKLDSHTATLDSHTSRLGTHEEELWRCMKMVSRADPTFDLHPGTRIIFRNASGAGGMALQMEGDTFVMRDLQSNNRYAFLPGMNWDPGMVFSGQEIHLRNATGADFIVRLEEDTLVLRDGVHNTRYRFFRGVNRDFN